MNTRFPFELLESWVCEKPLNNWGDSLTLNIKKRLKDTPCIIGGLRPPLNIFAYV